MDFFKLIQSLDELLYEILSWLLFYPLTLWRVLVHPVRMLHYADTELTKEDGRQFSDTLNPPLFLFLTVILIHLIELGWVGQSEVVTSRAGVDSLVSSDTSVIVLRALVFGLFPLLLARRSLVAQKIHVDREALKTPFYAQCYATAPFAILVSAAGLVLRKYGMAGIVAGLGCLIAALLWFGIIQVEWFRTRLKTSYPQAFKQSSIVMAEGLVVLIFAGALLE